MDTDNDPQVNHWIERVESSPYVCKAQLFENGTYSIPAGEDYPKFHDGDLVGSSTEFVSFAEAFLMGSTWHDARQLLYFTLDCISSGLMP